VFENQLDGIGTLDVPSFSIIPLIIASATATEADENGQNTVHFVTVTGLDSLPLASLFPANIAQYNHATALLDPNGNLSDIFGVYRSGSGTELDPFTYAVAFVSDPDQSLLTGDSFPGFGTITTRLPEDQDSYDATSYLGITVGAVELFPYTATFSSDREVPDSGTTLSLLGLAVTGLALLRRKLA
jgi:hypothetical protein